MQLEQLPHEEKLERSVAFHFKDHKDEGDMIISQNHEDAVWCKCKIVTTESCKTGSKGYLIPDLRSITQQTLKFWEFLLSRC